MARGSEPTATGPVPAWLGRPAARVIAPLVRRRNRAFDAARGVARLDIPVISIGNLSLGGTGKTPMTAMVVRLLRAHGRVPCIATRGYRSEGGRFDEPAELREMLPGVPVVVGPDRARGLRALLGSHMGRDVDCAVLDDGFQHRRLARDLDVVLIDATASPFEDTLFPAGWLREPVESLARAHAIVITRADEAQDLPALREALSRCAPGAIVCTASHEWEGLVVRDGSGERSEETGWLGGRRVVAACAIGNPDAFVRALERAGATIAGRCIRRDHHPWRVRARADLRRRARRSRAEAIITTGKDWARLAPAGEWGVPLVRPRLGVRLVEGGAALEGAILRAASPYYPPG